MDINNLVNNPELPSLNIDIGSFSPTDLSNIPVYDGNSGSSSGTNAVDIIIGHSDWGGF